MKTFKVELLQTASDEIDNLFNYILLDSPQNAKAMADRVFLRLRQLEQFPKSGISINDKVLKKYGFRMLVEEPYIVFYNLDENTDTVFIHRILHGAMDWLTVLKD